MRILTSWNGDGVRRAALRSTIEHRGIKINEEFLRVAEAAQNVRAATLRSAYRSARAGCSTSHRISGASTQVLVRGGGG